MKINVKVKPKSSKGPKIEPQSDGSFIVYLREIAAGGKANEALIKLLSKHFNLPKTRISICSGQSSHNKIIDLDI